MSLAVLAVFSFWIRSVESWSYSDQEHWPGQCQALGTQSPINIDTMQVQPDASLAGAFRCDYITAAGLALRGTVFHGDHSLQLRIDRTDNHTCWGIPFRSPDAAYQLAWLEIHWAQADSTHGSEHAINGEFANAELQMVHFNTFYANYTVAADQPGGLFVLSIMFSLSEKSDQNDNVVGNDALYDLASHQNMSSATISSLDLLSKTGLDPSRPHRFFSYKGSLTSPPCSQDVDWILSESQAFIELPTLVLLRGLTNNQQESIAPNIRNLMPVGNRNMFASWNHAKQVDDHAKLLMLIVSMTGAGIVLVAIGVLAWLKFKSSHEYKDVGDSRYSM